MADALAFMHAQFIIYLDLKPANALIVPIEHKDEKEYHPAFADSERVIAELCDFGCSVILSD